MDLKQKIAESKEAHLILADGTEYHGYSMGAEGTTIGEVVFTTGMTGYQETLTDPSYYGQIVTQTFPLIGNYGINHIDHESDKIWPKGYIVRNWCEAPSNFRSEINIEEYLLAHDIIGIYGIDTRSLTKKIRNLGVMNGAITTKYPRTDGEKEELLEKINAYKIKDAVDEVSVDEKELYKAEESKYKVVLIDYGYKKNILRNLSSRGCDVVVMPHDTTVDELLAERPDGIMLSNGPGDPADNVTEIKNLKDIAETDIPLLGICLGHQLLALAMGAKTEKLKYGHRGANQPVADKKDGKIYVTSQNHGYAVISDSIDPKVGKVGFYNVNDGSCEGIRYNRKYTITTQFHPEAASGPKDTQDLFDKFIEYMDRYKEEKKK